MFGPRAALRSVVLVMPALFLATCDGCDYDPACAGTWEECAAACPSDDELEASQVALDAERDGCLDACPLPSDAVESAPDDLGDDDAALCVRTCQLNHDVAAAELAACDAACDQALHTCLGDVCAEDFTTEHLVVVEVTDWSAHVSRPLASRAVGLLVCSEHFPEGSAARDAISAAIEAYNEPLGVDLTLTVAGTPHLDKASLFPDAPARSAFDYVVMDSSVDPGEHACKQADVVRCGDLVDDDGTVLEDGFLMNTCPFAGDEWTGASETDGFVISANAECYAQDDDPASDDFPATYTVMHELGHAVGMNHASTWPLDDQQYLSVQMGDLDRLSAYDVALLRAFYPDQAEVFSQADVVASPKLRVPLGDGDYLKGTFAELNPTDLYVDGDALMDCATGASPMFYAAWFNTGNRDMDAGACFANELVLRGPDGAQRAHRWRIAPMPAASQDHWSGTVDVAAGDLGDLGQGSAEVALVLVVDALQGGPERTVSNNEVSTTVTVHGEAGGCP